MQLPRVVSLRAYHAECGCSIRRSRRPKLHAVGDIERLGSKLQVETPIVSEAIVLEDAKVEVILPLGADVG